MISNHLVMTNVQNYFKFENYGFLLCFKFSLLKIIKLLMIKFSTPETPIAKGYKYHIPTGKSFDCQQYDQSEYKDTKA